MDLLVHLVDMGQKSVSAAPAQCPWGNCLAHSFSEALAKFIGNFLRQEHQLFCRASVSWKSEPCRQWHPNMTPSEKQMDSTLSLWVSVHPHPPTLPSIFPSLTLALLTSGSAIDCLTSSCEYVGTNPYDKSLIWLSPPQHPVLFQMNGNLREGSLNCFWATWNWVSDLIRCKDINDYCLQW